LPALISRRNDDLDEIAQRESTKLAYGADNPYARTAEYDTIDAVTREDLVQWHKRTIAPANMILGMAEISTPPSWNKSCARPSAACPGEKSLFPSRSFLTRPNRGFYFIEKNDVNQSSIELVDLGIDRPQP